MGNPSLLHHRRRFGNASIPTQAVLRKVNTHRDYHELNEIMYPIEGSIAIESVAISIDYGDVSNSSGDRCVMCRRISQEIFFPLIEKDQGIEPSSTTIDRSAVVIT